MSDAVPEWLTQETFRVEHNPNCPSTFKVYLCLAGRIHGDSRDAIGYGKTLREAAGKARIQRDAIKALHKAKLAGVEIPGVSVSEEVSR